MRKMNEKFADKFYLPSLAYALIYARPFESRMEEFSHEWLPLLQSRHQSDVSWVNDTFFGGRDVVKIYDIESNSAAQGVAIRDDSGATEELDTEAWRALLEWARGRLESARAEATAELFAYFDKHVCGEYVLESDERIPEDFNPIEYLVVNRDVLDARANAYCHYLEYGIAEGRSYKIHSG
jgi:hypothetical protein